MGKCICKQSLIIITIANNQVFNKTKMKHKKYLLKIKMLYFVQCMVSTNICLKGAVNVHRSTNSRYGSYAFDIFLSEKKRIPTTLAQLDSVKNNALTV